MNASVAECESAQALGISVYVEAMSVQISFRSPLFSVCLKRNSLLPLLFWHKGYKWPSTRFKLACIIATYTPDNLFWLLGAKQHEFSFCNVSCFRAEWIQVVLSEPISDLESILFNTLQSSLLLKDVGVVGIEASLQQHR